MTKIDIDKFVRSLVERYYEKIHIDPTTTKCWLDSVLEDQGLEYKGGEIVEIGQESEDERIRKELIDYINRLTVTPNNIDRYNSWIAWLEKQGEHKDYYTKQELIAMGFSFTLNGDIVTPDEMMEDMKKYLAWKEKQGNKPKKVEDEEYNSEDYGIDGLWHAKNILEKTLGEVEGYQSDDGIIEHKYAISAVKKLYEQKPTEWSEQDERMCQETIDWFERKCFPYALEEENPARESIKWLRSLKQRMGGEE